MTFAPFSALTRLPLWSHVLLTAVSVFGFVRIKPVLDASYAASRHPVDYATGQTTFDGARIKEFYAVMQEAGTLDLYHLTQMIDFGFILAVACLGLFLGTLAARAGRPGSLARRIGFLTAGAVLAGALCDAIENAWSFVMLADPQGFADWLALPYSGFASAKFALLTLGMALLLITLLLALAGRILRRPALG